MAEVEVEVEKDGRFPDSCPSCGSRDFLVEYRTTPDSRLQFTCNSGVARSWSDMDTTIFCGRCERYLWGLRASPA